jgi:Tfp pilus assembly protein PilE
MKKFFRLMSVTGNEKGFTALELIFVVVGILALLVIAGPKFLKLGQKSNVAGATSQLDGIIKSVALYYGDNKAHPKAWTDLTTNGYMGAAPGSAWALSCTNGGDLKVTYTAGDLATQLDTDWDVKCDGGASVVAGTSNVDCILTTTAYCP